MFAALASSSLTLPLLLSPISSSVKQERSCGFRGIQSPSAFSLSKTHLRSRNTTAATPKAVFNDTTANIRTANVYRNSNRSSSSLVTSSAAADVGAVSTPPGSFAIGIAWFFMHQIIGVANDVIMKAAGQTLSVAQVVFLRFFFATLTMLPVMLLSGKDSFKTDRLPLHFARSALLALGIFLLSLIHI